MTASFTISGALLDPSDQEAGCSSLTILTDGTQIWEVKRFGDIVVSSEVNDGAGQELLKGWRGDEGSAMDMRDGFVDV